MNSLHSLDSRAVRRASVALFIAAATLAACDTDRTVSPTPTPPRQAPATTGSMESRTASGNMILKAVDVNNVLLGGAQYKIIGPQLVVMTVTDNDQHDTDPTFGIVHLVNLPVGTYKICETIAPAQFALPDPPCRYATISGGVTTTVWPFVSGVRPYVQTGFVGIDSARVAGGIITVKDSTGTPVMLVADNSGSDTDKRDGYVMFQLPGAGQFSVCGAGSAGYATLNGQSQCITLTFKIYTVNSFAPFQLYPAPSIAWGVRDPSGPPIGPSTFTIARVGSPWMITVSDNGPNDLDPRVGLFIVKLPAAGTYNLCQTAAPLGHAINNPPCGPAVVVGANAAVFAYWFSDPA